MAPRSAFSAAALFLCCLASCKRHQAIVEFSSDIPPPAFLGGATCSYGPTDLEKRFYDRLSEAERITTQDKPSDSNETSHAFTLRGHQNRFVSWWGIVRDVQRKDRGQGGRLLIENKYFDSITDCSFQTISINGGGDFDSDLTDIPEDFVPLILVRIYGTVREDPNGRPSVKADYVRAWHWGQFRFDDYGEDRGNPEWKRNAKLSPDENPHIIRNPENYYRDRLAPRAEQWEVIREFHRKRTVIEFANIPLQPFEEALYEPTEIEKRFFDKLTPGSEQTVKSKPGEPFEANFQLRGHVGQFVSWFGIVREVAPRVGGGGGSLLIENKYFRTGKDDPPLTVSINGGGNFRAQLTSFTEGLPLSLVRVYGSVVGEEKTIPIVQVDYVRVWRWGEFDFDDYGLDDGDRRWKEGLKLQPNESIHQAQLSAEYYIKRLGPSAEEAQTINRFFKHVEAMRTSPTDQPPPQP